MFWVDTHIHLQDYKTQDVKNVVTNALKFNVKQFVNVSSCPRDWSKVQNLAEQYPQIIPAYGIHPWYVETAHGDWADDLEKYIKNTPKAWVGECGIDRLKNTDSGEQEKVLLPQIKLAKKYGRPLVLHSVKANEIMAAMFDELPQNTIFHSFVGSEEWGREIQKRGFYLGLNFSILKKKNYEQILQNLNPAQILLETDGPYQAREKDTETLPQNLPDLAEAVAKVWNFTLAEFNEIIYNNWLKFNGENHG